MEFEAQQKMDLLLKATAKAENAALPLAKWKEEILKQAAEAEPTNVIPMVKKRSFKKYLPYACTAAALVIAIGIGASGIFSLKGAAKAAPAEAPAAAPAAYAAGAADMVAYSVETEEAAPMMEEGYAVVEEIAMEEPTSAFILPDGTIEEEAKEEDLPAPKAEANHDPKRQALYAVMDALGMEQVPSSKVLTISDAQAFADTVWTLNDHQPREVDAAVHMVILDETAIAAPIYIVDSETYEVYGYLPGA